MLDNPSIYLLILKFFSVTIISLLTGWSLVYKKKLETRSFCIFLFMITGSSLLLVSMILASIIGLPAIYGLIVPAISLIIRISLILKNNNTTIANPIEKRELILLIIFIIISGINYFAPMIVKNTSGFYSRGGGDHSSYLSLSEYFLDRSIWSDVKQDEIYPTHPNWMGHSFVFNSKNFLQTGPIANQFIASPFMALLPGSNEETFTASTGYYCFLAAFSYLFLLSIIIDQKVRNFSFFAGILFLNPVTVYIANSQSIPFLFGIALMNTLLGLLALSIKEEKWEFGKLFFIQCILGTALLLIYPHLYLLGLALGVAEFIFLKKSPFKKSVLKYLISFIFITFLFTNYYLLISLHLIFISPTMVSGSVSDYTWKNLLSVWSGIADFGFFMKGGLINTDSYIKNILIFLLPCLVFIAGASFFFKKGRKAFFFLFLTLFFLSLSLFYNSKGLSYQSVRFMEMGQPYFLCIVILGLSFLFQVKKRILKIFVLLCFGLYIAFQIKTKNYVTKEIIERKGNQSEFRDAKDILLIKKIQSIQEKENYSRVLYYFGNGYGVETAGMSVLLRKLSYIFARGFTYGVFQDVQEQTKREFKPFDFMNKEHLNNCMHLVLKGDDILNDLRVDKYKNLLESDEFFFYDLADNPNASQLLGEGWNPILKFANEKYKSFRYLKAGKNAVVIWSQENTKIKISITAHSDQEDTNLTIYENGQRPNAFFSVRKWDNTFIDNDIISINFQLNKGVNVLLLEPSHKDKSKSGRPWLYVWDIRLANL